MKKIMIIAVMAAALSLNANAQQQNPQMGQRMDRTEMIKMRTEAMAKEYGLDEAQQQKLLELNTQYPDAMPRMGGMRGGQRPGMGNRPGGPQGGPQGENGQRPRRMGQGGGQPGQGFGQRGGGPRGGFRMPDPETMEKYNKQLKEIMGEEKYNKYQADQEEARKRFMERMQQMQQQNQ
ncbi:MAG: DUF4890 domain-containing protein [Prevotella sp.]|nr:DUF4890 domain-containing protein [Prevotella sp.]MBP5507486.1 DUF4890 domain-containing protein [Prevotella sp.]